MSPNAEANFPSISKRKASSTVGRGKVANLNTNFNFSAWSDEYVTLYLGDSLQQYDNWEQPTVIVSDGAYGILGFEGDTSDHIDLPNWYQPHIAILNQLQTNRASLIVIKLVLIQAFHFPKSYIYNLGK